MTREVSYRCDIHIWWMVRGVPPPDIQRVCMLLACMWTHNSSAALMCGCGYKWHACKYCAYVRARFTIRLSKNTARVGWFLSHETFHHRFLPQFCLFIFYAKSFCQFFFYFRSSHSRYEVVSTLWYAWAWACVYVIVCQSERLWARIYCNAWISLLTLSCSAFFFFFSFFFFFFFVK